VILPAKKEDQSVKTAFLIGKKVYLRPLEFEDLNERYLSWLNDPVVSRYLESGIFPSTREDLEKFFRQVTASRDQVMLAIVNKETDQHIGNVKLGPINWVHRKATFGILVGDKQFWNAGIGTEATQLTVEYAFFRLNLRRIDLGVYAEHEAAVHSYERVGFRVEGRFREDLFHEGQYKDRLWMGLLSSEYKCEKEAEGR
jgi:ribosomal-protein-alanine N-acetyltransferase